ncbi:MAG: ScpA family protein [Patescibacteria group bacterium]|nr:ScpA family protein [Patescibacteria group bacterium]MDD5294716.1 ScpA family protein [Patescibacteria group bacterium]MDD5554421.1 ScpA family protein [Patescibacteria group bacterium]
MLQVKTEKFEGPLGLLLQLIEKEELDITEVSLAKIADQYINYMKELVVANPDETADFLVIAAKLLYIKSKALLPYLYTEEDEGIEELEQQLKMYKEFLEAMKVIEAMIGKKKFTFAREFDKKAILANLKIFSPPTKLNKEDLALVFKNLISQIRPEEEKLEEEKLERKINIEDKILAIQKALLDTIKVNFSKFLAKAGSKTEIIVSFLAILELIKQRDVFAEQEGLFGEITINKNN